MCYSSSVCDDCSPTLKTYVHFCYDPLLLSKIARYQRKAHLEAVLVAWICFDYCKHCHDYMDTVQLLQASVYTQHVK